MNRDALDEALLLGAETLETAATLGLSDATLLSVSRRLMDARAALAAAPDPAAEAREAWIYAERVRRDFKLSEDFNKPGPFSGRAAYGVLCKIASDRYDALLAAEREVCPQTCPVQIEPGECAGEDHSAAQAHGGCGDCD